jgi:hypothetical protein
VTPAGEGPRGGVGWFGTPNRAGDGDALVLVSVPTRELWLVVGTLRTLLPCTAQCSLGLWKPVEQLQHRSGGARLVECHLEVACGSLLSELLGLELPVRHPLADPMDAAVWLGEDGQDAPQGTHRSEVRAGVVIALMSQVFRVVALSPPVLGQVDDVASEAGVTDALGGVVD